jgi:hypothetical protein
MSGELCIIVFCDPLSNMKVGVGGLVVKQIEKPNTPSHYWLRGVAICLRHSSRNTMHDHYSESQMYILASLAPNAKDLEIGFALNSPKPITPLASFARLRLCQPACRLRFSRLVRPLALFSPFPLYSIAGAVDGGKGAGWDGSGPDCSAGGARAGVSLPGVLSTSVFVLFRLRGVEGRSGESGTRSTSFSGVAALILS